MILKSLEQPIVQPRIAATFEAAFGVVAPTRPKSSRTRTSARRMQKSVLQVGPHHHLNVAQTVKVKKRAVVVVHSTAAGKLDNPPAVKPLAIVRQRKKRGSTSSALPKTPSSMTISNQEMVGARVYAEYPDNHTWYWGLITRAQPYNHLADCCQYEVCFDDGEVVESIAGPKIHTLSEYLEHRALLWPHLVEAAPPERPRHLSKYSVDKDGNIIVSV
jgi:hypothetical protein